jgi:antitoxin HicB
MEKTIDYYMNLPYTLELQHDPEEGWFIKVRELRGCMSQGDTPEEAVAMLQEAMELWLEVALEEGLSIPEPRDEEDYSGKFVLRMPRSLHRELVESAAHDGVSLNQYINVVLARAIGQLQSTVHTARRAPDLAQPDWGQTRDAQRSQAAVALREVTAQYSIPDETPADDAEAS